MAGDWVPPILYPVPRSVTNPVTYSPTGMGGDGLVLRYLFTNSSLSPAGTSGPTLSFTRASNATYWDSAGVLQLASSNAARFDHNPSDNTALGLLIEEARTNIMLQSEDFSTTWTKQANTTITTNDSAAPDGNTTADLLTVTTDANNGVQQNATVAASTQYAQSVFIKPDSGASHTWWRMLYYDGGSNQVRGWFNAKTGAVGSSGVGGTGTLDSWTSTDVGNGWYRLSLVGTHGTSTNGYFEIKAVDADNSSATTAVNGATLTLWGAQREAGAFSTSYIPTTTASATRAAEVCRAVNDSSITAAVGDASEMTVIARCRKGYDSGGVIVQINDGLVADQPMSLTVTSNDLYGWSGFGGGANSASLFGGSIADQTDFKIAAAYSQDDGVLYGDGSQITTDTSYDVTFTGIDTLIVGRDIYSSTSYGNFWIKEIKIYNVRKPNSFLQKETT